MKRLLELKSFCLELGTANREFKISDAAWNRLPSMVDVLSLFANKMEFLQKSDLLLTDVVGVWIELDNLLGQRSDCTFATRLLNRLRSRKDEMGLINNDVAIAAQFLDLRFHFLLSENQKQTAKAHLQHLWRKMRIKRGDLPLQPSAAPTTTNHQQVNENVCDLEKILQSMESTQMKTAKIVNADDDALSREFEQFSAMNRLRANENIMQKWQQYKYDFPILFELSNVVMAVAATEVSVERNFSILDFILSKRRNRLTDQNLEMILFVKLNKALFYESFENRSLFLD